MEFLDYLNSMEEMALAKSQLAKRRRQKKKKLFNVGHDDELSASCFLGLVVTCRTALELVEYLCTQLGYNYLLTRRINQDALEVSTAAL